MENKRKIVSSGVIVLAILAVMLAVMPSTSAQPYPANSTYFVPMHSTGAYCENNTLVEIRVNTSVATTGVDMDIYFDPNCINITAVNWTGSAWPPLAPPGWTWYSDHIHMVGANPAGQLSGDYRFANITLHCINASFGCTSYLNFSKVVISDMTPAPVQNVAWHNGTVTCEVILPPYLVTYTISNRTITPPQTTSIDVEFSEQVNYKIAIEKNTATIYDWTGTDTNPSPRVWNGTYETNGTVVPAGDYTVNVTGTNTTTGLSVINNTEIITVAMPDLNVSSIDINPGDTRGEDILRVYVNESNNISAVVWNNGTADAGGFDVCFDADGTKIGCVGGVWLIAGTNTTVSIDWTPTCANFSSVMLGFPPTPKAFWINVTADCNCTNCPNCPDDGSNGKIPESDETNNTLSKYIPAVQLYFGRNVLGGVVNNGYKSKNFDCNTTEEPLTLFEYDSEIVGGGIVYNVSGKKTTLDPTETTTRTHHIDIPDGSTVKKARLYVYWYDWNCYKYYPTACIANLSVNFTNGSGGYHNFTTPDASYTDQKGFGAYNSGKGTYAYNVTSLVTGSGDYTAVIKNIDQNNKTIPLGELLYVVYENPDSDKKIQLWTLEGNDYLMQGNATHPSSGGYKFGISEEEATATVAFPGSVELARVTNATLVTVVAQGREEGMNMLFNDNIVKRNAWDWPTEAYPNSKINVESVNMTANLTESGNNMGFQDTGTTGMQASNAFLVITYEEEVEEFFDTGSPANPYPSIFGTHNGTITVDNTITVNRMYTYPCVGTGGHTELVKIWNETTGDCAEAHWDGYIGDYHNISFNKTLILKKGVIYNCTIRTGSYPQIHHPETGELEADGGTIRCTKFTDANGVVYYDWIPAIKLY